MIVYKAVVERAGKLVSFIAGRSGLGVEYKVGEKTLPKVEGSPLYAFECSEDAVSWAIDMAELSRNRINPRAVRILKCRARGFRAFMRAAKLEYQWHGHTPYWFRPHVLQGRPMYLPPGTVLCKHITPIEVPTPSHRVRGCATDRRGE